MVCVLYTRSLTRIYTDAHTGARRRAGRRYYKTCVYANPCAPRFRRRGRRRRHLSRSRRDGSLPARSLARNFAFSSFSPPFVPSHDFSRDLPSEVFGFLNANETPRPNSNHVTPPSH